MTKRYNLNSWKIRSPFCQLPFSTSFASTIASGGAAQDWFWKVEFSNQNYSGYVKTLKLLFWQRHVKIRRTGGGAPDLASGLSLHQVQSLQLVAWLMSVCHVILGNGTFFFDIMRKRLNFLKKLEKFMSKFYFAKILEKI